MLHNNLSVIVPCPVCHGSGRNPEAPTALADDEATCLVCCYPLHPWYAASHGHVRVPVAALIDAAESRLCKLADSA